TAWAIFPAAILPAGRITAQPIPARAAYGASEAEVLPVEAHTTISAPPLTAFEIAVVIPRSLKEPVGLAPSTFRNTRAPVRSERAGASTSGVPPSPSVTIVSDFSKGSRSKYSAMRSEEHTSELQSRFDLVCRLLL